MSWSFTPRFNIQKWLCKHRFHWWINMVSQKGNEYRICLWDSCTSYQRPIKKGRLFTKWEYCSSFQAWGLRD